MKSLDNHIEGTYDPNAPFNQPNPIDNEISCLEAAWDEKDEDSFYEILNEVRKSIKELRDKARQSENEYQIKKLSEIYNKL